MFWGKKRLNYQLDQSLHLNTPFRSMSFTIFDTETTGFAISTTDRVIEIGAVQVEKMKVTDKTFQAFVNPSLPIPAHITKLTSIEQHDIDGAPAALEVIGQFFQFMENHNSGGWVGHCLSFDAMVIKKELSREKYTVKQPMSIDTVDIINFLFPTWDMRDLEEYSAIFGTEVFTRHRALGDALTTAHVFVALLEQLEKRGLTTLADLIRLSGNKTHQRALQF